MWKERAMQLQEQRKQKHKSEKKHSSSSKVPPIRMNVEIDTELANQEAFKNF
jgi:hypothetical protein